MELNDTPRQSDINFEGGERKENLRYSNPIIESPASQAMQTETRPESVNLEMMEDGPKLQFFDERKYLVLRGNCCGQMISRLVQFLLMALFILVWLFAYTSSINKEQSKFFVVVFFGCQAISFVIVSPLFILFHSIMMYKGLYCGVGHRLFPLSHMLLTDLRDNAENMLDMQQDNKFLQEDYSI